MSSSESGASDPCDGVGVSEGLPTLRRPLNRRRLASALGALGLDEIFSLSGGATSGDESGTGTAEVRRALSTARYVVGEEGVEARSEVVSWTHGYTRRALVGGYKE